MSKVELIKPKKKTLDKLSMLAGFQDWNSLKDTLHGDTDADVNYEGEDKK